MTYDQAHPKFLLPNKMDEYPLEVDRGAIERWQARWGEAPDWHMRGEVAYALRNRLGINEREQRELDNYHHSTYMYFMHPFHLVLDGLRTQGTESWEADLRRRIRDGLTR